MGYENIVNKKKAANVSASYNEQPFTELIISFNFTALQILSAVQIVFQ